MSITKFASFESSKVLELKGTATQQRTASLDKISDFHDYRTSDGYLYARIRAISSRTNKNHDGWPSVELAGSKEIFDKHRKSAATGFTVEAADGSKEFGFATFVGKPIFVDHHNSDPKRARGVIVDSKLNVLGGHESSLDSYYSSGDVDPEHMPPTEVELLLEVDAKKFPKLAKAVQEGEIDGFSMGCDVESSKCSHCGNIATNPDEYCFHIQAKGATHDFKTADGKRVSKKSYENCYGIKFFEISAVFEPADETALTKEIRSSIQHEGENALPQSFQEGAPDEVDSLRQEQICPVCGEDMEGDQCKVCGYEAPPKGFDNPDLTKAKQIEEEMKDNDSITVPNEDGTQPDPQAAQNGPEAVPGQTQPGSFLQDKTRNVAPTASVKSDMNWKPQVNPRVAGRVNKTERPIKTTNQPATNEPTQEVVISDQAKPVTSSFTPAMLTARNLIESARRNQTGDTMSTRTADGPTGPEAAPDKRVDVEGVGGVIEPSNEAASAADAQVDVTGVGSTGVTDVEADKTETLPDSSDDNAGFNKDRTTDDSGPTKTYGDSDGGEKAFTDPVTNQTMEASQRQALDSEPFVDDSINQGGGANKGVQPVDAIGKAQQRVDVRQPVTTPANNSGETKTWSGTDGNGVLKQQDPVTTESIATDGWTPHTMAALKVADTEVELGLITPEEKYNRFAELESLEPAVLSSVESTLTRVRTAGLARLAAARTSGVTSIPRAFGQRTAAPGVGHYDAKTGQFADSFQRVATGTETTEAEVQDESVLDSGLFS